MRYQAKPVIVKAFVITARGPLMPDGSLMLELDDGRKVRAAAEMMSRYFPDVNDYWVIQEDGYIYINPREVFQRKYTKLQEDNHAA